MRHVLVLTAFDAEARGLARHLGLAAVPGASFPYYRLGAVEVVAVGMRGALLDERLRYCRRPSLVVSAGVCGALDPGLGQGDLVIPEVVIDEGGSRWSTAAVAGLTRRGTLFSSDAIAANAATKSRLWLTTGALAVDMESGPIVSWARTHDIPAAVVRGVSDTATEVVPADLASMVGRDGRSRPLLIVHRALFRPSALADALCLGRGLHAALTSVAAVLGRLVRATPSLPPNTTNPSSPTVSAGEYPTGG